MCSGQRRWQRFVCVIVVILSMTLILDGIGTVTIPIYNTQNHNYHTNKTLSSSLSTLHTWLITSSHGAFGSGLSVTFTSCSSIFLASSVVAGRYKLRESSLSNWWDAVVVGTVYSSKEYWNLNVKENEKPKIEGKAMGIEFPRVSWLQWRVESWMEFWAV